MKDVSVPGSAILASSCSSTRVKPFSSYVYRWITEGSISIPSPSHIHAAAPPVWIKTLTDGAGSAAMISRRLSEARPFSSRSLPARYSMTVQVSSEAAAASSLSLSSSGISDKYSSSSSSASSAASMVSAAPLFSVSASAPGGLVEAGSEEPFPQPARQTPAMDRTSNKGSNRFLIICSIPFLFQLMMTVKHGRAAAVYLSNSI